jgi:hypothetical protein
VPRCVEPKDPVQKQPDMKETSKGLVMSVPYPLNPAFRAMLKTAAWDGSQKAFVAAATTANKSKWRSFLEQVKDVSSVLALQEHEEATAEQLERSQQAALEALHHAQRAIAEARIRQADAVAKASEAREQTAALAPLVQESEARLEKLLQELRDAQMQRSKAIAPVLALYQHHGLDAIIGELERSARRGYPGKEAMGRALGRAFKLHDSMQFMGFELKALNALVNVSHNRPDSVLELCETLRATCQSGVRAVAA